MAWPRSARIGDPDAALPMPVDSEAVPSSPADRPDPLANLRERWRLARRGAAAFEDPFLSRSAQFATLDDGLSVKPRPGQLVEHDADDEDAGRRWRMFRRA